MSSMYFLSGKAPIMALSDIDAGYIVLAEMVRENPDLKISEVAGYEPMSGWLTSAIKKTGGAIRQLGASSANVVDYVGDKAGSIVRLVADPEVSNAITKAGAAYATGGASVGIEGTMKSVFGAEGGSKVSDFLKTLGSFAKGQAGGAQAGAHITAAPNYLPWLAGGAGVLALVLLMRK